MSMHVVLRIGVLLWGTTPLFEKLARRGASPVIVLLVRTAFIAASIAAVAAATGQIGQVARREGWSRWS